jgi:hypothetical protein
MASSSSAAYGLGVNKMQAQADLLKKLKGVMGSKPKKSLDQDAQ